MRIQPPRRAPDDEQKLMVLYCLSQLGPCTELQLLQFLFEHDLMNYFEMMFALNDLCDRGQAARAKKQAGFQYEVTDAGREALRLFGGRIPRSLQSLMDASAAEWKGRFRREAQSRQKIEQTQRGEYEVSLAVVEQDMDLMELRLTLPTRELAQQILDLWPQKASDVYGAVIRLLSGGAEGGEQG